MPGSGPVSTDRWKEWCSYEQHSITTTENAQIALELLRDKKNKFNLVISDVDMPDIDGFTLLDLLGLQMDLPVIMLSAHSHSKYVMEGVKHGACDYLLKSVRVEEFKNIWQHGVRKSMFKKMKSILTNGETQGNYDQNGVKADRKRKDQLEEEEEERGNEDDDTTAQKKPRVIWNFGRERQFLTAVNHVGIETNVS